jgi:putative addiction module component (TIGR02574 family)
MNTDPIFKQALSLSPADRVRLIDELWASVVSDAKGDELSQEQKGELLRRLAAHRAEPETAISWDEVQKRLKRPA